MAKTPDVVDGAIIQTAWGNEIRNRTVQVFATTAERDSQWPTAPSGSMSVTTDTGALWRKVGTAWLLVDGLLFSSYEQYQGQALSNTGGILDHNITLPMFPVNVIIQVQTSLYAGFGGAAISSAQLQLYTNGMTAPPGGAYIVAGPTFNNIATGTWASVGATTMNMNVTANTQGTAVARLFYGPASGNCWAHMTTAVRVYVHR